MCRDVDSRAGVIAAQNGFPAGLAYAAALGEARRQGAQTVDGDPIADAIQSVHPVAQEQLMTMSPPQLRQAFQAGLITREQARSAAMAQRTAQDQPAPSAGIDTENAFANAWPLVTAGDIAIDETDKTQLAQRAALS